VCRSKHVEPSINFGIINSITKLHVVGISTESSTMHGSMNIKRVPTLRCFNGGSLQHSDDQTDMCRFKCSAFTCIQLQKEL